MTALLFDLDGTMLDTDPIHLSVFAEMLAPEGLAVDHAYRIPDSEGLPIVFDLLREEGLCMGLSTGINVAGAIRLSNQLVIYAESGAEPQEGEQSRE